MILMGGGRAHLIFFETDEWRHRNFRCKFWRGRRRGGGSTNGRNRKKHHEKRPDGA